MGQILTLDKIISYIEIKSTSNMEIYPFNDEYSYTDVYTHTYTYTFFSFICNADFGVKQPSSPRWFDQIITTKTKQHSDDQQ